MNSAPVNHEIVRHPGVDSGIDLINSGVADALGIGEGTYADYTGHRQLFALKDQVAVARWQPDYWREDVYEQAGWYCVRTHLLILREAFWDREAG